MFGQPLLVASRESYHPLQDKNPIRLGMWTTLIFENTLYSETCVAANEIAS